MWCRNQEFAKANQILMNLFFEFTYNHSEFYIPEEFCGVTMLCRDVCIITNFKICTSVLQTVLGSWALTAAIPVKLLIRKFYINGWL